MRNRIDNGRLIFLLLLLLFGVPLLPFHSLLDFLRVNLNSRELLRSFVSSPSGSPDSPPPEFLNGPAVVFTISTAIIYRICHPNRTDV